VGVRDEDEHRLVRKWLPGSACAAPPTGGSYGEVVLWGSEEHSESVFNLEVEK
jgi:hypothetical protein